MWIRHNCWINFCHFFDIVNLVVFHYEFVKVCRCFYATNENIHVLSMKFPHLFLRPEIIITFLWRWEWSGGGGGGGGGRCDTALRGILVLRTLLV